MNGSTPVSQRTIRYWGIHNVTLKFYDRRTYKLHRHSMLTTQPKGNCT
jgi:hypothetical protein